MGLLLLVTISHDTESHASYLTHVVVRLQGRQAGDDHVAVVDTVHLVDLVLTHTLLEYLVVGVQHHYHLPQNHGKRTQ